MKTIEIKTIDIKAKTWFDKVNGNSYFAALVTINFGLGGTILREHTFSPSEYYEEKEIKVPFQYGYGEQYITETLHQLQTDGILPNDIRSYTLNQYCTDNNIILRTSNQKNCLKRDLKNLIA